jgi:hypothetical protein
MDLNLIPPDIYSFLFEGAARLSMLPITVFLFAGLIGGMGNNALTEPAKMSGELWTPFTPFIDHYLQIHGAQ